MDERFTPGSRLADAAAFSRVFKKAQRSRDKLFTVLYRDNEENEARLGLAIAKKHCHLATGRNRIKRVVRESFRRHRAELAGLDIVVLNRPEATQADSRLLFTCLEKHWQKCQTTAAGEVGKN
jgi:ribonuclease P protein component